MSHDPLLDSANIIYEKDPAYLTLPLPRPVSSLSTLPTVRVQLKLTLEFPYTKCPQQQAFQLKILPHPAAARTSRCLAELVTPRSRMVGASSSTCSLVGAFVDAADSGIWQTPFPVTAANISSVGTAIIAQAGIWIASHPEPSPELVADLRSLLP